MRKKDTEMKIRINEVVTQLKSAKQIALFCHINPDCDTICSALALRSVLVKMGKSVDVYCDGELKSELKAIKGAEVINVRTVDSYDTTVAVDCGDMGRVGKYGALFKRSPVKMCIDHHKQISSFADITCLDTASGATAELIYLIIQGLDSSLMDTDIATYLYTALVTDTGNFSFASTGPRTFQIASELMKLGVKNADISYIFFKEIQMPKFKLKGLAISKTEFFDNDTIGVMYFSQDDLAACGATSADTSNLVNEVLNVGSVRVAISITETHPRSYKVSIRTQGEVDASSIAGVFGGGGHHNAAGFMINGFYGNILDDILKATRDRI